MNYLKHFKLFYQKITDDNSLNTSHLSLYLALFMIWSSIKFKNPLHISREELMKLTKINSKTTYHKCLKDLHESGYIRYRPSFNPHKESQVFMLKSPSGYSNKNHNFLYH